MQGGQGGFEDVRRYVKQGGDFCKELASILHERYVFERFLFITHSSLAQIRYFNEENAKIRFTELNWKLRMRKDSVNSVAS